MYPTTDTLPHKYQALYSDLFVQTMYAIHLQIYQDRYNGIAWFPVTWQHVSQWRKQVCMWGRILVQRSLLSEQQYLQDKAFRFGDTLLFTRVQNATALTYNEVHAA